MDGETHSLEAIINNNFSGRDLNEFNRIYYGRENHLEVPIKESSIAVANDNNFDIAAYAFPAKNESTRPQRIVKVGIIQHSIVVSTDRPINEQRNAIFAKVKKIIDVAGQEGVNILCLQEFWNMPYVFCTREKQPWCEFAESAEIGPTTRFLRELAVKYSMVIVSSILERDENHGDILWDTVVVISDTGNVIGKHRKNHIPRVGDFNESNYYMEGNTGHPVFATRYDGKPAHKDLGLFYGSSYFCGPDGVRCPGLSRTKDGLLIAVMDLNMNRQIRDRRCYYMTQRLDMYAESLKKVLDLEFKPQVVHETEK
ncbi:unnamed protein product [Euphydryas editha]|uniref:CN hydrolase domain-containing protein n=1 Tax=Euphydryas editha TaxID=104508 RepID=A0AAU9TKD2_EUPED|nr:unnamed protein product [Euphydryas editha]